MKKSMIIIIAGIILVVAAVLFFSSKNENQPPVNPPAKIDDTSSVNPPADDDDDDDNDDNDDNADNMVPPPEMEEEDLPEVTSEDISEAVSNPGSETEEKFLTAGQKEELNSASMNRREAEPRKEQKYRIEWAENETFDSQLPELPKSAPVYLLDRPEEGTIFGFLKDLGSYLDLKGAVIRMSPQVYALANIQTGEYFLTYDVYHLLFEADNLNVLTEEGDDGVMKSLRKWGLLGFPYTEKTAKDQEGNSWYRYIPDLELPVLTLKGEPTGSSFEPGALGEVDVESDGDYITHIISNFPNIKPKDELPLADAETIKKVLQSGEFALGNIELQYPGALSIEEKRDFYDYSQRERVAIESAELSQIDCGYFLEDEKTIQTLLSPVCIAHGKAKAHGNTVFFTVLFPAVQ